MLSRGVADLAIERGEVHRASRPISRPCARCRLRPPGTRREQPRATRVVGGRHANLCRGRDRDRREGEGDRDQERRPPRRAPEHETPPARPRAQQQPRRPGSVRSRYERLGDRLVKPMRGRPASRGSAADPGRALAHPQGERRRGAFEAPAGIAALQVGRDSLGAQRRTLPVESRRDGFLHERAGRARTDAPRRELVHERASRADRGSSGGAAAPIEPGRATVRLSPTTVELSPTTVELSPTPVRLSRSNRTGCRRGRPGAGSTTRCRARAASPSSPCCPR